MGMGVFIASWLFIKDTSVVADEKHPSWRPRTQPVLDEALTELPTPTATAAACYTREA
jgi:hypothetical protein